tara:strand:+ start:1312 stop:2184 length:873 start_codon:yes stop_codon:yes gene_type:complete
MSILNIFKPDSNFTIGSNTQRTEPFTAGGLLLRDPNKTINIAPKDFVPGINLDPEAQAKIAAEKEAAFKKETEPKEETTIIPEKKQDESSTDFLGRIGGAIDKIFTLQQTNPESYNRFMSGLDLYKRGQEGEDIATALLGNSKYNAEQAKALFDASLKALDFQQQTLKVQKTQQELSEVKEPSKELQSMAASILEKQYDIKDEGVAFALSSRAKEFQLLNPGVGSGTALNFVIERAVETGELVSGKNAFGSGKFKANTGKSKSVQEVMKQFNMSKEEATQEIIDQGFVPR